MDRFMSTSDRRNSFVLVASDGEEGSGLWVIKVLLIFRIIVSGSTESRKCALSRYTEVARSSDTVSETLAYVFPKVEY